MDRLEAMERARESEHCLRPAEAFSLLGDETRVAILEALRHADDPPVAFTALYERTASDNSAQFSYHLGRLTGHYVRKTGDGYELRTAGENVVQAVVEGSFNAHPDVAVTPTGDECTQCRSHLVASYDDEKLAVECSGCDTPHGRFSFPPGGLIGRGDQERLSAFDRRVRHRLSLARDGVCPECSGQMRTRVVHGADCRLDVDVSAEFTCLQCHHSLCSSVGLALLDHPAVVSFHRDRGLDLRHTRYWRLAWCVTDECLAVDSETPWRLRLAVAHDGDTLTLSLDGDLNVVATSTAT